MTPFGCSDHQTYQFVELNLGGIFEFPFGVTISLEITADTNSSASHRFCLAGAGIYWVTSAATAVELSSFSAQPSRGGVSLRWETAQEVDNSGFHLLRSATKNGDYRRITKTVIPSDGSLWEGAAYSYEDREAASGKTWFYKLEDIDYSGKETLHGPEHMYPADLQPPPPPILPWCYRVTEYVPDGRAELRLRHSFFAHSVIAFSSASRASE